MTRSLPCRAVVLLVVERTCSSRVMSGEYCVRFSSLKKLISSSVVVVVCRIRRIRRIRRVASTEILQPPTQPMHAPLGRFMNRKIYQRGAQDAPGARPPACVVCLFVCLFFPP